MKPGKELASAGPTAKVISPPQWKKIIYKNELFASLSFMPKIWFALEAYTFSDFYFCMKSVFQVRGIFTQLLLLFYF